ncbi:hypothetical protein BDK51DRAFT_48370 [Blyttiomyces helicus]|uniref:Uncharacterized protein n=1 Tax=Blyttiomyces helicus TaxID=388810 RepID=A0A4P9W4I5_9FUNG|nr:hypothetical protein BDK51DRAFT_48370 [Blyttiomyces helicus]|eukprot:RKO85086.1 hypothetical protein BDK51DRAFT_48370 [Blyttiomyces helicus]
MDESGGHESGAAMENLLLGGKMIITFTDGKVMFYCRRFGLCTFMIIDKGVDPCILVFAAPTHVGDQFLDFPDFTQIIRLLNTSRPGKASRTYGDKFTTFKGSEAPIGTPTCLQAGEVASRPAEVNTNSVGSAHGAPAKIHPSEKLLGVGQDHVLHIRAASLTSQKACLGSVHEGAATLKEDSESLDVAAVVQTPTKAELVEAVASAAMQQKTWSVVDREVALRCPSSLPASSSRLRPMSDPPIISATPDLSRRASAGFVGLLWGSSRSTAGWVAELRVGGELAF